ncbi:UvrB/UvrC motif-containing protein, partial [bacterium]|nr:UvrB/UvrC motif-containing protein [bacterium]
EHAIEAGFQVPQSAPVTDLLTQFATMQAPTQSPKKVEKPAACETCGSTFARFRKTGLLGCPECYEAFCKQLDGVIARSQNGASNHTGRVPDRSSALIDLQALRRSLIEELDRAVASEQYERAASLRDRLHTLASESGD